MTSKPISIFDDSISGYIFDLDGVVTNTTATHAKAWKKMFDQFLSAYFSNETFEPFDYDADYKKYVDGKSRNAGIQSFLQSRGIILPLGEPDDKHTHSITGLGTLKNNLFRQCVAEEGIEVFPDALKLIQTLKKQGYPVGLATSSKNAEFVLKSTGLEQTFDCIMDGTHVEAYSLRPKPAPDIFIFCNAKLKLPPENCVIFEDAIAGVQAAVATKPAVVVGVNREGAEHAKALLQLGAHIVASNLATLI